MKRLVYTVGLFMMTMLVQAQEAKSEETTAKEKYLEQTVVAVTFDVDRAYFPVEGRQGQAFYSSDNNAVIMGQLIPIPFNKMEDDFNNGALEKNSETLEKEVLQVDGRKYLFIKQRIIQGGRDTFLVMYARTHDSSNSVLVSAFYNMDHDAKRIDKYAKRAALSAEVKE